MVELFANTVVQRQKKRQKLSLPHQRKKKEDKELVGKDSSNYNRLVALILCIFLGDFGAHDFYVGRTMFGAIKLGATILGAILAFVGVGLILILGVTAWVIYDIVMIASGKYTDKYNLPLKKWDSE